MSLQLVPTAGDIKTLVYLLAETLNKVIAGRANNTGTFTLTAGATTTVVIDTSFESSMVPGWIPTTATAATAMTKVFVSARTKGSFTLTHDNTADVDRIFIYNRQG